MARWVVGACPEPAAADVDEPGTEQSSALAYRLRVGPVRAPVEFGVIDYADVVPPGLVGADFDTVNFEPFEAEAVAIAIFKRQDGGAEVEVVRSVVRIQGESSHSSVWMLGEEGEFRMTVRSLTDERLLGARRFSLSEDAPAVRALKVAKDTVTVQVGPGLDGGSGFEAQPTIPVGPMTVRVRDGSARRLGTDSVEVSLFIDRGDDRRLMLRDNVVAAGGVGELGALVGEPGSYRCEVVDPRTKTLIGSLDFNVTAP